MSSSCFFKRRKRATLWASLSQPLFFRFYISKIISQTVCSPKYYLLKLFIFSLNFYYSYSSQASYSSSSYLQIDRQRACLSELSFSSSSARISYFLGIFMLSILQDQNNSLYIYMESLVKLSIYDWLQSIFDFYSSILRLRHFLFIFQMSRSPFRRKMRSPAHLSYFRLNLFLKVQMQGQIQTSKHLPKATIISSDFSLSFIPTILNRVSPLFFSRFMLLILFLISFLSIFQEILIVLQTSCFLLRYFQKYYMQICFFMAEIDKKGWDWAVYSFMRVKSMRSSLLISRAEEKDSISSEYLEYTQNAGNIQGQVSEIYEMSTSFCY